MKSKQSFGDIAGLNPVDITAKEIKKDTRILKAWCTSFSCSPTGNGTGNEKKNAKKSDTYCPDCGHALFWGREEL